MRPKRPRMLHKMGLGTLLSLWTFSSFAQVSSPASCAQHAEQILQNASLKENIWILDRVSQIESELQILAKQYPDRLFISHYGNSFGKALTKITLPSKNPMAKKVLITAGVHGNEALSPLTAINLAKAFAENPELSKNIDLTIYPTMSPHGVASGQRRVRDGIDLNRNFTRESTEPEIENLIKDLQGQRFDLALDLHGGPTKEHFFIIQANDDQGLAEEVFKQFPEELFLESHSGTYPGRAGIPSDPTRYEMSARGIARSHLKGTLKSYFSDELKIPYSYTLEYPGKMNPRDALTWNQRIVEKFLQSIL